MPNIEIACDVGIKPTRKKADVIVPVILPIVAIEKTDPLPLPTLFNLDIFIVTRYGDIAPMNSVGIKKSRVDAIIVSTWSFILRLKANVQNIFP